MSIKLSPRSERRATYSTLTALFLATFSGFALYKTRRGGEVRIKPIDLVQLALASYRLGRLVSFDQIFEPFRTPFTRTVKDESGMGMTIEPKGSGFRRAIGDLLSCPICSGTWISAGLVYGLNLFPRATRTFLAIMSSIGAAEILNAATEALEWTGQLARERAGAERAQKEEATPREHSPHDHFSSPRMQPFPGGEQPMRRLEERAERRRQQT
jgi:hypothetical protein